jgi:hypothetical protein
MHSSPNEPPVTCCPVITGLYNALNLCAPDYSPPPGPDFGDWDGPSSVESAPPRAGLGLGWAQLVGAVLAPPLRNQEGHCRECSKKKSGDCILHHYFGLRRLYPIVLHAIGRKPLPTFHARALLDVASLPSLCGDCSLFGAHCPQLGCQGRRLLYLWDPIPFISLHVLFMTWDHFIGASGVCVLLHLLPSL